MKAKGRSKWKLFDDESKHVDRFGLLLLVTTLAVITLSLVDLGSPFGGWSEEIGLVLLSLFVGATFLLALRASGVARRYRLAADIFFVAGMALTVLIVVLLAAVGDSVDESVFEQPYAYAPPIVWVLMSAIAPMVVVRRLVRHRTISSQTILGAVSGYLLIAVCFYFAFLTLNALGDGPFFGKEEPTTAFMYHSLVTITTLGFGDLTASGDLGRLATTMEAVIGQVYLVTFVAMIVGLFVAQRMNQPTDEVHS